MQGCGVGVRTARGRQRRAHSAPEAMRRSSTHAWSKKSCIVPVTFAPTGARARASKASPRRERPRGRSRTRHARHVHGTPTASAFLLLLVAPAPRAQPAGDLFDLVPRRSTLVRRFRANLGGGAHRALEQLGVGGALGAARIIGALGARGIGRRIEHALERTRSSERSRGDVASLAVRATRVERARAIAGTELLLRTFEQRELRRLAPQRRSGRELGAQVGARGGTVQRSSGGIHLCDRARGAARRHRRWRQPGACQRVRRGAMRSARVAAPRADARPAPLRPLASVCAWLHRVLRTSPMPPHTLDRRPPPAAGRRGRGGSPRSGGGGWG